MPFALSTGLFCNGTVPVVDSQNIAECIFKRSFAFSGNGVPLHRVESPLNNSIGRPFICLFSGGTSTVEHGNYTQMCLTPSERLKNFIELNPCEL